MTRIRQAGPPVLVVALIAGLIGYIIGCTREQQFRDAQARAQETKTVNEGDRKESSQTDQGGGAATQYSPVKARARDFYTPNSEDLGPDEMRLVACGTGMPTARPKQAASCWLLELGNGDKFIFDIGTGSAERISALQIPYN